MRSTKVCLEQGVHTIKYKVYCETEFWKNMVISMGEKGFTLSSDGRTFVKTEGGSTLSARSIGVSHYGWNRISKEVSLEGSKSYWLSEAWH